MSTVSAKAMKLTRCFISFRHPILALDLTRFFSSVMMFIGFGFLMTFLNKYGLSSIGFNFLVTVLAIQWNIFTSGTKGFWYQMYEQSWNPISLDIELLIESDFAAACMLISMGAVLGKTNALQLAVMVFFEMIFFNFNLMLSFSWLKISDQGGSIVVHTFGAFFGLAVSWMLSPPACKDHKKNSSSRTSDLFAMIGTLFLWMYWPSFNGALASGQAQHLVVVNTTLALCASAVSAFLFSIKLRGKFSMVDIQNATLAGGVAVGTVSNMMIEPVGAMIVGFVAGAFCVVGYVFILPALETKLGLYDTCGVQNLHGYSGIIGGLASVIAISTMSEGKYAVLGLGETQKKQALQQLIALVITLLIAIVSGLFTGFLMKIFSKGLTGENDLFEDSVSWDIEGDSEDTSAFDNLEKALGGTPKSAEATHEC
jgi:ammonium transporter Rh